MEIWKDIKGFEGEYSISSYGRVRNEKTGRVTYGRECGNGYKKVSFWRGNKEVSRTYVHRLVANAFLPKGAEHTEVNHKDGNRANNHISNLEWVSSSGNTEHAVVTGALLPWGNARKPIIATDLETGAETYFVSISKAEVFYGTRHIDLVLKGKRKSAKGHTFRYAEGGGADVVNRAVDL
jgi:hypothetical protein